jgi:topoisomerase-4 subunit A
MPDQHTPPNPNNPSPDERLAEAGAVTGMYKNWFLEYASYVILDRAVPALEDGLKPVQRRILHALKEMDDGRFHKVANAIGQTMQYHPHGDASIYEALVGLGQKDLLIETQGNWGDMRTGDSAAAPRYIEARLSKFALEVAFNADNTEWQLSYDGRKREPVHLPLKFPLLLAQGVEGIAVGLSTRIMPHNFTELCKASIDVLRGKEVNIYPDFPTGGMVDVSNYNEGKRGGKIRVRARIMELDKKTLAIKDIPFSTTTGSLIESIVKASDKGKIKIKKVVDNTAKDVEIQVELAPGVSPDVTIDALYAFTDCEVSISPNCCIIIDNKPRFIGVNELLRLSTANTLALLKAELENKLRDLLEDLHFASLEQIFIEKRIYRRIEECETFEAVIETIDKGLRPYIKQFVRDITREDIIRLTEIRIKRISKYDSFKANERVKELNEQIAQTKHHLAHLTEYAVSYFNELLKKYGKNRERRTEIRNFDNIIITQVAIANAKLYVNRNDGFIGTGLKKDELVCDCSDLDDIIVFRRDGRCLVTKVAEKTFVGKDIMYVDVWKKNDERRTYHLAYLDGETGISYVKRFNVTAVTRDREYMLIAEAKGSKVLYFSAQPNSESEEIKIWLSPTSKAKIKEYTFNFGELAVKGRESKGNILARYPIKKIAQTKIGASTLGGRKVWIDETIGRLNIDGRGKLLGEFDTNDRIIVVYKDGSYELTDFELTNRYEMKDLVSVEKFSPTDTVLSAIYYNAEKIAYFVKRFRVETSTINQRFYFVDDPKKSPTVYISTQETPCVEYDFQLIKGKGKHTERVSLAEFIDVKGWKAIGNKLTNAKILAVREIDPKTVPTLILEEKDPKQPKKVINQNVEFDIILPSSRNNNDANQNKPTNGDLFS